MTGPEFPLPLTAFERYMVLDDRPRYPMTFQAEIEFDGVFQREVAETAMALALERHPLLRATVSGSRAWRQPLPTPEAARIRWLPWTEDTPAQAFERIDIAREVGIRVFIQQTTGRSRLTISAHHAAVDGGGLARFAWEFAAAYAAALAPAGTEPLWGPSTPDLLRRRGAPRRAQPAAAAPAASAPVVPPPREVAGFLFRPVARVRASKKRAGAGAGEGAAIPAVSHTFGEAEFERIRRTARAHDASVNDVFLCELFQTLAEWNAPAAPYRSRRWMRVMVPTDLRSRGDAGLSAANVLGFAFVDRRACDCANATALLHGIRDEMRSVRATRTGHRIVDGMALVNRIPGLLRLILRLRFTLATAVFSNVGRIGVRLPDGRELGPDAFGAHLPVLRRVRAMVPLRPGTRAGFLLTGLRDTLTLTLRTDPRYLDGNAARTLLAACVGRVNDICRDAPAS